MKRLFTIIICLFLLQITCVAFAANLSPEFQTSYPDTTIVPVVNHPAPLPASGNIFKRRLDSLKKDIPLDYNGYVQSYIDIYTRNRDEMGHVLGLTKYYFPIYEKAFHDTGIPEEIKYLSIVESKLDPNAVSRVGAAGPWQFMFTTARMYGLNMDDYVDDRRDPIQASYAAAAYLKDAYQEFGDWLLAIAAYNCGSSSVAHAIEKAGANDFWSIRPYLPAETRGYVPAFIAIAYVMNYYKNHNIVLQPCKFSLKNDTVLVNKYISLSSVSKAMDMDMSELLLLNPAYKKQIINGTDKAPRRLVLPQTERVKYSALYEALNNTDIVATVPRPAQSPYHERKSGRETKHHGLKSTSKNNYVTYKVKSGDTLSGIAAKFEGATVAKIKALNGLKKDQLKPGTTIRVTGG